VKKRVPVLLFLATVVTTLGAGAVMAGADPFADPAALLEGIPFSAALLTILLAHEFSHYVTSRRHGVRTTLPLFIPAPTLAGTFGAVIRVPLSGQSAVGFVECCPAYGLAILGVSCPQSM